MNILLYRWGAYTELDIESELKALGISVSTFIYNLEDKHEDDKLSSILSMKLRQEKIEALFSVNFFPVIAKICHACNVKYISWSYDCPLNVTNIEKTLGLSTNYVFMFDRAQANKYIDMGFDNVRHMQLAAPTRRYDRISLSANDMKELSCDISFVGNLYTDILRTYTGPLTDYQKGFINGLCASQSQVYGCYMLDELIDESLIDGINIRYKEVNPDTDIVMSKEALSYGMAANITRDERLTILGLLASHYDLHYYSKESSDILKKATYKGTCDYYDRMPAVFKASKINLNITLKILTSGIPLRALDIMGAGGFLLSNYQVELAETFTDGEDIAFYSSIEEAYEKASYYLAHDSVRLEIARRGYTKVKEQFSYIDKLTMMLKEAGIRG